MDDAREPLPGGEVGIPASRADEYYSKSLEASRAIIDSGAYSLLQGSNPGVAFNDIFVTKGHSEMILAKDFRVAQGKKHFFTMQVYPKSVPNQPFANWGGAAISPSRARTSRVQPTPQYPQVVVVVEVTGRRSRSPGSKLIKP